MSNIDNLTYKELKQINSLFGNQQPEKSNDLNIDDLTGKQVTFFCMNYIYHGEVISSDKGRICLKNAKIVYETGKFENVGFKNAQDLCCNEYFIKKETIESFGILPNKND